MPQPGDEDVNREDDEGGADEPLADKIHAGRKRETKDDDGNAEQSDGEGVAEGVEDAEAHALAPARAGHW